MLTWMMMMGFIGLICIGSAVYLAARVRRFGPLQRLRQKRRALSWLIGFALVLLPAAALSLLWTPLNMAVCLLHLTLFWLLADLVFALIRRLRHAAFKRYWAGLTALIVSVGWLTMGWVQANCVWRKDYTISTDKQVGSLRVALLSDSHMGTTFHAEGFAGHLQRVQAQQPDVVVMVGDFVDESTTRADMAAACQALGQLDAPYGVYFVFGNHAVVFAHGDAVSSAAQGIGVPGGTGQMPCRQRAVGRQGNAHLPADGNQLALILAIEQVIMILHRLKPRPAMVARAQLHIVKLIAVHGGRTQRAHLARLDQLVQRLHGFLDRRFIIETVDDIKVKIIHPQPLQAAVDFPVNGLWGQSVRIEIDLGGDDHPVAGDMLFQRFAQVFLAGACGIAVGRIEKVNTQIKGVPDHGFGSAFIQRPIVHRSGLAEAHAAHADLGDFYVRSPNLVYSIAIPPFTFFSILSISCTNV